MLHYKPVTVERLICTCDRCGKAMEQDIAEIEWQERFIISFRAGYGSDFGDGTLVEGDFCQECIKSVLGKWLRITNDDFLNAKHKLTHDAEKIMQPYQHQKLLDESRVRAEISGIFKAGIDHQEKRQQLAERLGVPEEQVASIAYDYLLHATKPRKDGPQTGKSEG